MPGPVAARLRLCSRNSFTVNVMGGCNGGQRLGEKSFLATRFLLGALLQKLLMRTKARGGGGGPGVRYYRRYGGGGSLENLHAMVEGVSHDDAPVAVDGDAATRAVKFSVA